MFVIAPTLAREEERLLIALSMLLSVFAASDCVETLSVRPNPLLDMSPIEVEIV